MKKLYKISFGNLYTDAFVVSDSGSLLFASILGRNADVQAFLAQVQLKKMENLTIKDPDPDDPRCAVVGQWCHFSSYSDTLEKSITKVLTDSYGVLEHLFLYQKKVNKLDYGTKSSWMISSDQDELDQLLWSNIRELADIPLSDNWEKPIITMLESLDECINTPDKTIGNIFIRQLKLPGDFNQMISDKVKSGELPVYYQ